MINNNRKLTIVIFSIILSLIALPLLISATGIQTAFAQPSATKNGSKPPNIVFILTDNLPPAALPIYGNLDIKTPNIDALAREGITFTHAYSTNGYCSPTRATLMTGLMSSQTGVHTAFLDNIPAGYGAIKEFKTFPQILKGAGYDTALIGKWHLGTMSTVPTAGFNYVVSKTSGITTSFYNTSIFDNGKSYRVYGPISNFWIRKASDYIGNHSTAAKPFFLLLSLTGPYWGPPPSLGPDPKNPFYNYYYNLPEFKSFPRTAINENILDQLSGKIATDLPNVISTSGSSSPTSNPTPKGPTVDQLFKQILVELIRMQNDKASMANLAAQVALLDSGVGKIINVLKSDGIEKNTLVLFSSDNSMFMGEHGLDSHTAFTNPSSIYEPAMKVPLIVSQPGVTPSNKTADMMISETDIAPTLVEYAGIKNITLPNSPGESFAKYLKGEQLPNWKKEVAYEQEESRGISTHEYQYVKRMNGTGYPHYINELYNLTSDPQEKINEYNNPKYSSIVKQLDTHLTEFFEKYSDPKYNEWKGGAPKILAMRENMWKHLWGQSWHPILEQTPGPPKDIGGD